MLADIEISCANEYASVLVIALDDRPVKQSAKLRRTGNDIRFTLAEDVIATVVEWPRAHSRSLWPPA